jgi:hypothetical protein
MAAALARGLARDPEAPLGPASWVTLARATLAVAWPRWPRTRSRTTRRVALAPALAAVALGLDLADGMGGAAHRGTATALGRASTARSTRS